MNCPVCDKVLNANLSICPSCGAMMDDEVREEVMGSVIHVRKPLTIELEEIVAPAKEPEVSLEEESLPDFVEEELVIDISSEEESFEMPERETQELPIESREIETPEEEISLPLFDTATESQNQTIVEVEPEAALPAPIIDQAPEPSAIVEEPAIISQRDEESGTRVTSPIVSKETSKLVLGFQNKNSEEPDWKLTVRNRLKSGGSNENSNESRVTMLKTGTTDAIATSQIDMSETTNDTDRMNASNSAALDLIKERALRRIEESRRLYGNGGASVSSSGSGSGIATGGDDAPVVDDIIVIQTEPLESTEKKTTGEITPPGRPKVKIHLVPTPPQNRDTNPLDSGNLSSKRDEPAQPNPVNVEQKPLEHSLKIVETRPDRKDDEIERVQDVDIEDETDDEPLQPELPNIEEIDEEYEEEFDYEDDEEYEEEIPDLAPIGQRFNAGLFDMLICAFASLLILSPYIAMGGNILSTTGLLLFFSACSLTTIVYQTLSLSLKGKTLGMRLFAIEVIDIEENEYPTMAQALGSSVLFVLSLLFLGIGFITLLFSPERRAFHDYASGTLMVREY